MLPNEIVKIARLDKNDRYLRISFVNDDERTIWDIADWFTDIFDKELEDNEPT